MKLQRREIRVGVVHGPGSRIAPVWFELDRCKHPVRQVTNSWRDRRGETVRLHFHVVGDGALFELVYTLPDATWSLEQIEAL
jgi:hypothetical protein